MTSTLKDYAEKKGIHYLTAWRHLKKGYLTVRRQKDRSFLILKSRPTAPRGHPSHWTKEKVVRAVYRLCKGRYVKSSELPPSLYKLSVKFCGSVRAAKWEAKIIHGRHWSYEKFIKCVEQFCEKRYRGEKDWPIQMRVLAKNFCGSIRAAKWEAGVIRDKRRKKRSHYGNLERLWTRAKFFRWVGDFCGDGYKKPAQWPGYMRELAVRYCGSVRAAKWKAKILKDPRKRRR